MCRGLNIVSVLKEEDLTPIMKEYDVDGEIDSIESDTMHRVKYSLVIIEGVNDKCLCNLTTEEKVKVYDFMDKISVI